MTLRLRDKKHQAILDAAIDTFRQQGYELTSMDQIAATANVSKRTVYNHFPSKEKLFAEILMHLWERSAASIDFQYQPNVSLAKQLHAMLLNKLNFLADTTFLDLARMAMAELIHRPDRAQEIVCRMNEKEGGLGGWIRSAIEHQQLKPVDVDFAAMQLEGLVKSFAFWPQVTMGQPIPTTEMREKIALSAVTMFLTHYAVSPVALDLDQE